jgi:16S rRNA (guanine966-N2)-methyltransferase
MAVRISGSNLIKTQRGLLTRPTPSKVRAAIFNIWQGKIRRSQWLDICCGSGAMSAEALMRGASCVVAVEISPSACKLIKQNLEKICKPDQIFNIHCGDAVRVISKLSLDTFDLIYFDPPYQSDLYDLVLGAIAPVMKPEAIIAVEHSCDRDLSETYTDLRLSDRRKYGQTAVSFFSKCE